jgi:hypothetical protein
MMKVLAAEMSDPSRLRRGKQYAKDGSVLDIIIEPGVVTCEIQGSRSTPYIAAVEVSPGDGMPLRRDIRTHCTCPDDDNWDGYACKHVVASMFTLSDEFLLEPELLDLWRNRRPAAHDDETTAPNIEPGSEATDSRPQRHLRLVRSGDQSIERTERELRRTDPLEELLATPVGTELPAVPTIERIEPELPRSRELAAVLRDAIGHLRIEWD